MAEESCAPNPWTRGMAFLRRDDDGRNAVVFEIKAVETIEIGCGDRLRQTRRDVVDGVRGECGGAEGGCHENGKDMVHGQSCVVFVKGNDFLK